MANTKITSHVIANDAVTVDMITDAAVTADKLHATLDLSGKTLTLPSAQAATTQSASDNTTKVATTAYVTTAIANLSDSAPAALNTLNEIAAALGDDANYAATTTTAIGTKLPKAGGTMTGAIAMGTSKITGLGDPTANQDAGTKLYIDTADALKLNLSGGTLTGDLILNTTTALKLPVGTTAQRPSAATGQMRWNTSDGALEVYNGSAWTAVGTGSSNKILDTFTGNGSTTAYTLSVTPANEDALIVFIDGVYQEKGDYALSNAVLTLDTAPASGEKLAVHITTASVHDGTSGLNQQFTGDGSTVAFTLSQDPKSENNTQIYINGVYQQKTDYTVSGTTLTFDTAPETGDIVEVNMFTVTTLGNTDTVSEGTSNLYHTDARARGAISVSGSALAYNSSTGVITSAYEESPTFTGTVGIGTSNHYSRKFVVEGAGDLMMLRSTNAGAGGAQFDLVHDSASAADGDAVGIINFSDDVKQYASIKGIAQNTNVSGGLHFGVRTDASNYNASAFMIDSAGQIGIGLGSSETPSYHVHIKRTGSAEIELEGTVSAELNLHDSGASADTRRARLSMMDTSFKLSALNDADNAVTHEFITMKTDTGNVGIGTISPSVSLDVSSKTDAIRTPIGTTAQRPSSPGHGMIRYNTTESKYEVYNSANSEWTSLKEEQYAYSINYLVQAGGGAGGSGYGGGAGGGGAGGLRTSYGSTSGGGASAESVLTTDAGTQYTVTVGAGGAAVNSNIPGTSGNNSVFNAVTSIGGGGGVSQTTATNGGCGGGGGETGSNTTAGSGTANQGFDGGTGNSVGGNSGAGGGGTAVKGTNSSSSAVGPGGAGTSVSITGSAAYYGGGGGASGNNLAGSAGGNGGGGNGGPGSSGSGTVTSGTANTGGGGGGTYTVGAGTASGGSGVVILRMPTANYSGTTTGSPTVTTSGSDTILKFTGSGTYTS